MAKKSKRAEHLSAPVPHSPTPPPAEAVPPSNPQAATTPISWGSYCLKVVQDRNIQRAIQLVTIAALYSHASQAALSPVYGSAPAALYHKIGTTVSIFLAFFLQGSTLLIPERVSQVIPTFAFWIPSLQFFLFKFSANLGNPYGPVVTECLTYYPLVVASIYATNAFFAKSDLAPSDSFTAEVGPSLGFYLLFSILQRTTKGIFRSSGSNFILSRVGIQLVLASLYAVALPSNFFWLSIPSVAFSMIGNVHNPLRRTTDVLSNTLALYDYTLLERAESVTGYISVLESNLDHFRVMRCDHSLLGGEWTTSPPAGENPLVKEPIYAIFTMLEAVRLIESGDHTSKVPDTQKKALNIGLGVGTAPSAMIAHGINTTIIELDPYVYHFSRKYFSLPLNHSYVIGDADSVVAGWAKPLRGNPKPSFDYIVHDVFTGGTVPVELFTLEFFTDLASLLAPDGAIAINYAGDISEPTTSLVYRTINAIFHSCRVFRETEPSTSSSDKTSDMTNMVIFCKKTASSPIRFRNPTPADYLGSGARKAHLLPKHEIPTEKLAAVTGGADKGRDILLRRGQTRPLQLAQRKSAVEHWKVMRTVLPDGVWENW